MAQRPKIKKDLPKKLPPVEPDTPKEEMKVTGEKLGPEITESFIKEQDLGKEKLTHIVQGDFVSVDELKAETFPDEKKRKEHPIDKKIQQSIKEATADLPELTEEKLAGIEHDDSPIVTPEERGEDDPSVKPAQPDKYPSHAGKAEQPFLFGEADQILNALETELTGWKGVKDKLTKAVISIENKRDEACDRITILERAINATRKHAPMTEDPAPPKQPGATHTPEEFHEEQKKINEALAPDKKTTSSRELTPEDFKKGETYLVSSDGKIISEPAGGAPKDEIEKEIQKEEKKTKKAKKPVAKGAAERTKEDEDSRIPKFRTPTQPLPEVLFPGDQVVTSWNTGPYGIAEITGPYKEVLDQQSGGQIPSPDHWSLKCYEIDAKRNKDGRLPKNYEDFYLNLVVVVGNRFMSVYEDSTDEIFLGERSKQESAEQQTLVPPEDLKTAPEEDIY